MVRDAEGRVLLRSHKANLSVFPPFTGMGFADTPTHRIYADAALQGTVTISVAEPLARRRTAARDALVGLALPLGLVVPISLVGVWAVVRLLMAPLRRFRSQIEARGAGDLTPISATDLPPEVHRTHRLWNSLLDVSSAHWKPTQLYRQFRAMNCHTSGRRARTDAKLIIETSDEAARETRTRYRRRCDDCSGSRKSSCNSQAEGGRLQAVEPTDVATILRVSMRNDESADAAGRSS